MLDGLTKDRHGAPLSLYWYSQVVGLDRGIQTAIRAAGLLSQKPQIHVRGSLNGEVRGALSLLAKECHVSDALFFQASCPPQELLSRAVEHDVGLALETADSVNRDLTVTNKFFHYLTAGLAVAATDTTGQRSILAVSPQIGRLHTLGAHDELAGHLREWQSNSRLLDTTKRSALDAAKSRWNAETEGSHLVDAIARVFSKPSVGSAVSA
jgi:hypothetical protein